MAVVLALCFIWPGCGPFNVIDHCSMELWDTYIYVYRNIAIVFNVLWAKLVALSELAEGHYRRRFINHIPRIINGSWLQFVTRFLSLLPKLFVQ